MSKVSVSTDGKKAVSFVAKFEKDFDDKVSEFCKRLAEEIEEEGARGFREATVNDDGESIEFSNSLAKTADGYEVTFSGEEITFVEFGAGVTKNGAEPYPEPRPAGIVGIGEYGKGKGKRKGWYYYGDDKTRHYTTGTRAVMPVYHAKKKALAKAETIKKEVFR